MPRVLVALSNDLMLILSSLGVAMVVTPRDYFTRAFDVLFTVAAPEWWAFIVLSIALSGYCSLYLGNVRAWRVTLCLCTGFFALLSTMFLASGGTTGVSTYAALATSSLLRYLGLWQPGAIARAKGVRS